MQTVKKLFYTTVALTLTSFLMKTIGVWYNVYLTSLVGSVGMGIFQLIMSVYAMAKTLAYGGMNLAATRLCIDDPEHIRHSMRGICLWALGLGLFAATLLFTLSEEIARGWIASERAALSLRILSFSLPFVAVSAALNGYMTAVRRMSRYSLIQLVEQVAKIGATLYLIHLAVRADTQTAMALVSLAITFSEAVSFSMALFCYRRDLRRDGLKRGGKRGFFGRFSRIFLPDAFGSYLRSALNTVEHLLIPIGIRKSGASSDRAFSDYGIVQGMALPVVLYPSSILAVLSSLLVPEIAECKNKSRIMRQNYMINRVLHVAMIFSLGCCAVMVVFADALAEVIYKNAEAAYFIRLLAPLIPIMYLDMTTDGMLKGLDKQMDIMKINVLDSVLCVALVFFLVPKIAVDGYLVTIYVAEIVNFILSFQRLGKSARLKFGFFKNFVAPLATSFGACLLIRHASLFHSGKMGLVMTTTSAVTVYFFLLRLVGGITKGDLSWFLGVLGFKRKKKADL